MGEDAIPHRNGEGGPCEAWWVWMRDISSPANCDSGNEPGSSVFGANALLGGCGRGDDQLAAGLGHEDFRRARRGGFAAFGLNCDDQFLEGLRRKPGLGTV